MKLLCPYCGAVAGKVNGRVIYPHRPDLYHKAFYQCPPCDAYVECHPGTDRPLGRLANAELRRAKSAAHAAFDPLWKQGPWTRKQAYSWLAKQLGIAAEECHIGHFDIEQCRRVVTVCKTMTTRDGATSHEVHQSALLRSLGPLRGPCFRRCFYKFSR
ncbi:MAG: zinc-finger-containing protein [Candidatus Contendobacter sp.]|nr:zinc-finger-containing protein [Candidatus Contendobacter sp.]